MGKIAAVGTVYRGMSGAVLPAAFYEPDEFGVRHCPAYPPRPPPQRLCPVRPTGLLPRSAAPPDPSTPRVSARCKQVLGGVESAFMSTTTDRKVALDYAGMGGESGKPGIVLEIEQGAIDRGADISAFSQYGHEKVG